MAGLEELMAGLFGGTQAPAGDEMRRRRGGPGGEGGYGGIGGALVLPGMMQQYYGGLPGYDFSGAMGSRFGGRSGLMSLLGDRDLSGPALRHFANQGFDFGRQNAQDNRERPGGPNVAPGNIDNAQSLYQPQGPDHVPGVPQGVAVGQAPGQVRPRPQTQGWRNIHPGYSATAAFGTDPYGRPIGFGGGGGGNVRPPAAQSAPPGASTGGGRPSGGGGGGGGAPASQNPVGGGGAPVRPGAGGGGGGGTGGGQASGGKQTGGGGGGGPQNRGGFSGVRPGEDVGIQLGAPPGGYSSNPAEFKQQARQTRRGAIQDAINQSRGGGPTSPNAGSGLFYDTIHVVPNQGNNNTPSEMGGGQRWSDTHQARYADESPEERQARLEAKAARQAAAKEAKAAKMGGGPLSGSAPSTPVLNAPLSQKALQKAANRDRGSGTKPLPDKGKTKPKSTSAQQR